MGLPVPRPPCMEWFAVLFCRRRQGLSIMARVRHGQDDWLSYHITTRILEGQFFLMRPSDKRVILAGLEFYRKRGDCELYGFVIMNNHIHVIIQPAQGITLARIVNGLKTWTSRRNSAKCGSGLWERRYDDNRINSQKELRSVLQYIHNNPVRAGIVTEPQAYPWSSIHNYLQDGRELIEIDTDWWSY